MSRARIKLTPRGERLQNIIVMLLIAAAIIVTGFIEGGALS